MAIGERIDQSNFAADAGSGVRTVLDLILGVNASDQDAFFIQLFDAAALPANGTTPVRCWPVAPLASFSYAPSQQGRRSVPGFWWAVSTTPDILPHAAGAVFFVSFEGREVE